MQDAAVHCDVLTSAGQPELGLECWARSAGVHGNPSLRYDYARYLNPWSADGKETPAVASSRESFSKTRPWLQRARQHLWHAQQSSSGKPSPKRRPRQRKAWQNASRRERPRASECNGRRRLTPGVSQVSWHSCPDETARAEHGGDHARLRRFLSRSPGATSI